MLAIPLIEPEPPDEPTSNAGALLRADKQGVEFTVRLLRAADRQALEAFYRDFVPKRAAQGLPPAGVQRVSRWLDSILPAGMHVTAWQDLELIGHAFVVPMKVEGSGEYAVFLRHDLRGRGFGTALTSAAVEFARAAGYSRLWLSVEPQNRSAIRSYEKVGFRFRPATIYSPEAEMELLL